MTTRIDYINRTNPVSIMVSPNGALTGILLVQQCDAFSATDRLFVPFDKWTAVRDAMQAVYDKHAPKKEDKE